MTALDAISLPIAGASLKKSEWKDEPPQKGKPTRHPKTRLDALVDSMAGPRAMICTLKHHVLSAAFAAMSPLAPAIAQEFPIDTAGISKAVISETNAHRASKNLPALQENASLQAAATAYAKFLAEKEAAGHTADGQTPAKRVKAQGYHYCFVAENMWGGWHRPDPMGDDEAARKAMEDWKRSPGHNANLLSKQSADVGIGAAAWRQSSDRVVFRIVQVFGKDCSGKSRPAGSFGDLMDAVSKRLR